MEDSEGPALLGLTTIDRRFADLADAEREALTLSPQPWRPKGWGSGPATEPWVVSIEESA